MPSPVGAADDLGAESWIDEAQAPFGAFVEILSIAADAAIAGSESVPSLWVERLAIEMPVELDVRVEADGRVRLAGSPPTQYTETSFLPVFHAIALTVAGEPNLGGSPEPSLAP